MLTEQTSLFPPDPTNQVVRAGRVIEPFKSQLLKWVGNKQKQAGGSSLIFHPPLALTMSHSLAVAGFWACWHRPEPWQATLLAPWWKYGRCFVLSIDGTKFSGQQLCNLPIPENLFKREAFIHLGRSMLKRFQMDGRSLEAHEVTDRLLLTY